MIRQESQEYGVLSVLGEEAIDPSKLWEEIDEELQLHCDLLTQDLMHQGMTRADAELKARQQFGNLEIIREQCFRIQTRNFIMLQRAHFLLTFVFLVTVVWLGLTARQPKTLGAVETAQALVSDASQPPALRLENLRWLRFQGPPGARSHDAVVAMIRLAEETNDPLIRADIFRQLDEVTDSELKQPLLDALLKDDSEEVREEAAESLGSFSEEKGVRDALQKARDQDPSPNVRRHAAQSFLRGATADQLKEILLNSSSMEEDRIFALKYLRKIDRSSGDPRDHEVLKAMIELAATTNDARVRADIFRNLDEVTDPILKAPLLDALEKDLSAEVRSEAAETLAHYADSSEVVEALKSAASKDQSIEVRKEAQNSLSERR